jgi:hypothetical protein
MMNRNCILIALCVFVVAGCGSKAGSDTSVAQVQSQTPAPVQPPAEPQAPPQAQSTAPGSTLDALEQLLAPVALYPDALLAQVLTAASSPEQVTEVNNWLKQNEQLQGTALQDAANQKGFDASFVALVLFPEVLDMLASNIDWTTELGTSFLSDPKGVMDSVQKLRAQAQAAGNLKTTPQQSVVTERQDGQPIIVIQPANPQVVYVPVYNPQVVYYPLPPPPPTGPPPVAPALIGFGLGVAIGAAMVNNAYYAPYGWGAWGMHWHSHTVVCVGRPWVPPPYARYPYVRPIPVPYGAYRPRPYAYAPTNININNVNVNRPVYAGGVTPRPTPYAPVARPPASPAVRPGNSTGRPPAGATTLPATTPATRPGNAPGRPSTLPAAPPSAKYPAASRPSNPPAGQLPATAQRPASGANYGSRGYNPGSAQPPSKAGATERTQMNSSAFTGYQNGNAERAASSRGQGSVAGSQKRAAPNGQGRAAPAARR